MAALWPLLQNRLVAVLPTLSGYTGVKVFDGPPVVDDAPLSYVTVGHIDDGTGLDGSAGSYQTVPGQLDGLVDESGSLDLEFVVWTGDVDLPTVRTACYALVDTLEAFIRADQTLGLFLPGATTHMTVNVIPQQAPSGSEQRLIVTVTYTARRP